MATLPRGGAGTEVLICRAMKPALLVLLAAGCASPPPPPVAASPATVVAAPAEAPTAAAAGEADAGALEGVPAAVVAPPPPADAPPVAPAPLPAGTVVLVVGSSTAGALGPPLKKELEARGIKCIVKNQDGSYIPEWAGGRMGLARFVAQYQPDLVIVSLGGNEVEIADPGSRAEPIRRIVRTIGDRPCLWVGTPRWKALRHNAILEVIEENAAPCRFVDSDEIVPNMKTFGDGVHPTMAERGRWARVLVEWLQQNRDPEGAVPWAFRETLGFVPEEESVTPP